MAQMDDSIGELLKHLQDIAEADNTIVIFTTDNGAEVFTWPGGGMTPFRAPKAPSTKAIPSRIDARRQRVPDVGAGADMPQSALPHGTKVQ